MNWIDICICVPLLWGLYKGFTKGLVIALSNFAALGLGIWGGIHLSDAFSNLVKTNLNWDSEYLSVISFCSIFIGIVIAVFMLGKFISNTVKAASLNFINKMAGGIFGILQFGLLISVCFFVFDALERSYPIFPSEAKNKSLLYKPVAKIAPYMIPGLQESNVGNMITPP